MGCVEVKHMKANVRSPELILVSTMVRASDHPHTVTACHTPSPVLWLVRATTRPALGLSDASTSHPVLREPVTIRAFLGGPVRGKWGHLGSSSGARLGYAWIGGTGTINL